MRYLTTEKLLGAALGLLLAVLCWTGNNLVDRINALEANQSRILVALGVEPIALEYRGIRTLGSPVSAKPLESNTPKWHENTP